MRTNNDERKIYEASGYLDDGVISDVLKKYGEKSKTTRPVKTNRWLKTAVALAACIALLALALPMAINLLGDGKIASTSIVEHTAAIPAVDLTTEEVETSPVYDGSRGLQYEVNEDGKSASFVGYGSCTDEVVYIASTYNGLPVTEMHNVAYWEAELIPYEHNFNSKYLKHLVISDTVQIVDFECIRQCPNIESVYYGASVARISPLNFNSGYGENFTTVEVSPNNPNFSDKGNCIVDLRTKTLVLATPTTVIPDDGSVEIIGNNAFSSAKYNLTSVVIPEGVKILARGAFGSCWNLESITLPDSLEVVDPNVFLNCQSLKTLELGTGLKAFDKMALDSIYFPQVYYKGTVAQWETVIKAMETPGGKHFVSVPVICTDGESLSDTGPEETYYWFLFPEYEAYNNEKCGKFMPEQQYREINTPSEVHIQMSPPDAG